MTRIIIENAFVFFLPTLVYLVWVTFKENRWRGAMAILRDAPLVKLFISGAFLMLLALTVISSRDGHQPSESYTPPNFKDGKLEPGHTTPVPTP